MHAEEGYAGRVYRVGDGNFQLVDTFTGERNRQSTEYDLKYGHDWTISHILPTAGWDGGLYIVQLSSRDDNSVTYSVPVMLRERGGEELLVVAPTNTWQAYNAYGGKSSYQDEVTPRDMRALFDLLEKASPGLVPNHYLPARRPLAHPFSFAPLTDSIPFLNGKV